MSKTKSGSFRVGKVQAYLRGKVWYLCYHDHGRRRRPRVGTSKEAARQLAAQINAQVEVGAPAALSFEPITIPKLRECWLQRHEQVLRSSVHTINRYRAATDHLLRFLTQRPIRYASHFQASHAEEFAFYLRTLQVSPNGHAHTAKRPLMDKGLCFVLECCRTLFNFAAKRRHLSPYAENPFSILELERIPIERTRPITLFTVEQEQAFFEACDSWQLPLFLTLMMTGLRPGELTHLLLPDDLDLNVGLVRVRNKPSLGWQVKTRNEREIPVLPVLVNVLRFHLGVRQTGPVFIRRGWPKEQKGTRCQGLAHLEKELAKKIADQEAATGQPLSRQEKLRAARSIWWTMGAVKEDRVRIEFMRLTAKIGVSQSTAPKSLRHMFATALQEGRVDPLIRNELMGHVAVGERSAGHGLAMTAVYTHTRTETRRQQLEEALAHRPCLVVAEAWLHKNGNGSNLYV